MFYYSRFTFFVRSAEQIALLLFALLEPNSRAVRFLLVLKSCLRPAKEVRTTLHSVGCAYIMGSSVAFFRFSDAALARKSRAIYARL